MNETLLSILSVVIVCVLILLILQRPYLGVIFTVVSLPMVDLLPQIPLFTSVVILIGVVTFAGFLMQQKRVPGKPLFNFGNIHIVGLLFAVWIFISNPQAAWFGVARNWFLTFIQLWMLIWLASELLDSPDKQHVFMWIFSIVSAISAVIALQQGHIGDSLGTSFRAIGLAGNPNSTARYLVIAMIFFSYLSMVTDKRLPWLLAVVGEIVTFLGVFFTLSRTGIILLFLAVGLIVLLNSRRKFTFSLIFTYGTAGLILWYVSDKILNILESIMPSILRGTDTIGLRYTLWQAAWHMWLDHIFKGVGIGMYPELLRFYAPGLPSRYWTLLAHNTYLMVLAETGLVGFILFMVLLIIALKNYILISKKDDIKSISLRNVWLITFLIVLLGGSTINGHTDKMLWFLIGISIYFRNQFALKTQRINKK